MSERVDHPSDTDLMPLLFSSLVVTHRSPPCFSSLCPRLRPAQYGIATPKSVAATTPEEAEQVAKSFGQFRAQLQKISPTLEVGLRIQQSMAHSPS